ncbi:hypothetical protein [Nocardiopsis sp. NPDC006938]|uniref:hypothetical protein n=1 Tax=Nocardiopsis sp. NPDC006938 TaxID=3364337 RepID=UPI0036839712
MSHHEAGIARLTKRNKQLEYTNRALSSQVARLACEVTLRTEGERSAELALDEVIAACQSLDYAREDASIPEVLRDALMRLAAYDQAAREATDYHDPLLQARIDALTAERDALLDELRADQLATTVGAL